MAPDGAARLDRASARSLQTAETLSEALVQDGDLVVLNMMLWFGGAKAVAINGERATVKSSRYRRFVERDVVRC
jgi:uncharacterized protein YlxW (UPF0749 family)